MVILTLRLKLKILSSLIINFAFFDYSLTRAAGIVLKLWRQRVGGRSLLAIEVYEYDESRFKGTPLNGESQ